MVRSISFVCTHAKDSGPSLNQNSTEPVRNQKPVQSSEAPRFASAFPTDLVAAASGRQTMIRPGFGSILLSGRDISNIDTLRAEVFPFISTT